MKILSNVLLAILLSAAVGTMAIGACTIVSSLQSVTFFFIFLALVLDAILLLYLTYREEVNKANKGE